MMDMYKAVNQAVQWVLLPLFHIAMEMLLLWAINLLPWK